MSSSIIVILLIFCCALADAGPLKPIAGPQSAANRMGERFIGEWKLVESENFEEYLKEIGINFLLRKLSRVIKPTLFVDVKDKHWAFTSRSAFKNYHLEFDEDVEFTEVTADGRTMRCVFHLQDDGKLVQTETHIDEDDKDSVMIRWVEGDRMLMTIQSGDVIARRVYQRVA